MHGAFKLGFEIFAELNWDEKHKSRTRTEKKAE